MRLTTHFERFYMPDHAHDDLRQALRARTAALHETLEQRLALTEGEPERGRFRAVTERWYGFYAEWEPAVAACLDDETFTRPRRRLPLLGADLQRFGSAPEHVPRCTDAAALCATPAAALGAFYVLEGATLGGRVITRYLGDAEWRPRSLDPYGDACGARWRETLARLEACPDRPALLQGAVDAFTLLARWLPQRMAEPA